MGKGNPKGRSKSDLALHMTISTMFAWAKLVEMLAQMFDEAVLSREMIHDFLDQLQDANTDIMSEEMGLIFGQMVASIRKTIPCND